jgi:signal transduction histidine kinase
MRHLKSLSKRKLLSQKETQQINPAQSRKKSLMRLERKNAELATANEDLSAFTYVSSHDLQEPLRKIRVFASILLREEEQNLSYRGKDFLARMQDTARRMQELLEALITYSRTREMDQVYETVNLRVILDQVKRELARTILEKHATVHADELCEATIIPYQFRALFRNLLTNALKFSDPARPPEIIINADINQASSYNNPKLVPEKKYCRISISDNGIGFDPQYKERIFEVFTRLNSADDYDGTGIGLAICRRIVENHDGIITAIGRLNEGARFDIYIPAE